MSAPLELKQSLNIKFQDLAAKTPPDEMIHWGTGDKIKLKGQMGVVMALHTAGSFAEAVKRSAFDDNDRATLRAMYDYAQDVVTQSSNFLTASGVRVEETQNQKALTLIQAAVNAGRKISEAMDADSHLSGSPAPHLMM